MNWILAAGVVLAMAICGLLLASTAPADVPRSLGGGEGTVISATPCDIDGDGVRESVKIVMVSGRLYEWPESYCGGGERYEGTFEIRVTDGSGGLGSAASINALVSRRTLFFWAEDFQIWADDYNGDGSVDFNLLSSDAGCNGCRYYLFTIGRTGELGVLSTQEFYAAPPRANSTRCIRGVNGQLAVTYYSQATGTDVTDLYDWVDDAWVFSSQDAPTDASRCISRW